MEEKIEGDTVVLNGVHLTLDSEAGPVEILRGIDLRLSGGETVSVVGPSGSGKSSMLMIIGGLERPTSGSVTVADAELTAMDEDALARFRRDHLGIVFQDFHLIPTMTAVENVAIPLEFSGRSDAFERAEHWLAKAGLGHRLSHYPGQLSGGEQQRVALARALAVEPALLLADEPTGNLDGATGRQVVDLLFGLTGDSGTTVLLITHDPGLAAECDRTVQMLDGRIVESASESSVAEPQRAVANG